MQAKGAVVFIREARVRTLRVEHLEEAVDVVLSVLGPLVAIHRQEADFCEQDAPVFRTWPLGCFLRSHVAGDVVE